MGIGIRVPKFGMQIPNAGGRPSSQEVMAKLKERNPGDFWRSSLYPAWVDTNAGFLTGLLGGDPIFQAIAPSLGLTEGFGDIGGTFDFAHEIATGLSGADTYSDEWQATKNALKNETALASAGSRPSGFSGISRLSAMGRRSGFGSSLKRFG